MNIGASAFTTTLNVLSKFIFSVDFAQYDTISSQEFKEAVMALVELAGKPNLADFFPILKPLDPQGLVRKGNVYGKKLLTIFDRIINQRLQLRSSSMSTNIDVLDLLLNVVQKDESIFSRDDMRHFFYVSQSFYNIVYKFHMPNHTRTKLFGLVWFLMNNYVKNFINYCRLYLSREPIQHPAH